MTLASWGLLDDVAIDPADVAAVRRVLDRHDAWDAAGMLGVER